MKYVITDCGEARVGSVNSYHSIIAEGLKGRVVAAGYCRKLEDGSYEVWGSSIGYNILSRPEDAIKLKTILNK